MTETTPIATHGVTERFVPTSDIDLQVEEIRRRGFTIIEGLYDPAELEEARETLKQIYAQQVEEIGGVEKLQQINDVNIVRTPLAYSDFYLEMATHPKLLPLVKAVIGQKVSISSQVGILNRPGFKNYQEAWHRELQYQHFTSSRPLAVQALFAIDPFTIENGGTFFLEGSHLFEEFPSDAYVRKYERQMEIPAGSAILFNSMVYHRGAQNHTQHDRIAVNCLYTLPIIHQQINIPNMLGDRPLDTPEMRQLLGYEWNPAADINTWRRDRLKRAERLNKVAS